jgi:DNA-binding NtrC family response regulator
MTDDTSVLKTFTTAGTEPGAEPCASLLIYHRNGSLMVELREDVPVVVGRARPSDISIRDTSLSRQHARFLLTGSELWVEDLNSTNGTRINGKKVQRGRVGKNDEVRLGSVTVAYHALGAADAEAEGMDGHDQFVTRLEQELVRARTFNRPLAVMMVQAARRENGHVSRWAPRLQGLLRPVDLVGLYDDRTVLIGLVESGAEEATMLGRLIVDDRPRGQPALRCGICLHARQATTDQLIAEARAALRRTTQRQTVVAVEGGKGKEAEKGEGAPVVLSPRMQEIYRQAERVADSPIPVLIYGETGTGKEVLAQTIHDRSGRRRKPIRFVNCGAIPEQLVESVLFGHERGSFTGADQRRLGVFEEANGGTVMLDEVGELSAGAQTALLRVLESKRISRVGSSKEIPVDVRIVAATNRDLQQMCQAGGFRIDLFYRLESMVFHLPPLRERVEEILPLVERFIKAAAKANSCKVPRLDEKARRILLAYDWPGNVRELRNVIERAVVIADEGLITPHDLSERVRGGPSAGPMVHAPEEADEAGLPIKERLQRYEARLLLDALETNNWNQTRTAEALDMPLRTLVHKIKKLGLQKRYGRD